MRRTNLFIIITIVSLVSLVAVVVAGFFVLTAQNQANTLGNVWSGMMGGMMGGSSGTQVQAQNAAAPYLGVAFVVLVGVAIIGIGGIVYFFTFPEIRNRTVVTQPISQTTAAAPLVTSGKTEEPVSPYESVVKTLTADERKVIEVIKAHDGKYLQKYIRNEAGLSRLQTHRIVARLAERGVVSLEKTGNTNTVLLANWLK